MNWNVISRNVGYALLVNALFMFISILVSVFGGNDSALAAMIISFTITFIVGVFPLIFVRKNTAISLKEGYVIIVLAWLLSFIVGMLPYALWGGPFTLQNAWFESVSGYTTCGATILHDIEDLPKSLLFWRSATHFIGGLGVVVFLLLIIPESSPMRLRLTNMELTSLSKTGYASRSSRTVIIFASVYVALFVFAALSYALLGMPVFDAICHAMSVAATGGFSTKNLSIAAFDSRWIEGVTMLFMYLSSIHFGLIYISVVTRSFKPFCNPVVKAFTMTILAVALVISAWMMVSGTSDNWFEAIWGSLFHTISTVSTTGFAILDNYNWSAWVMMLLAMVGIVSGCAGSTTGGIKVDRTLLLLKSAGNYVDNILHPSSVNEIRFGKKIIQSEDVSPHLIYIGLYFICLVLSILLSAATGVDHQNAVVASISTLSNIGPACAEMGAMGSFADIPAMTKLLYSFNMFIGRIEIYPVLAVLGMLLDKRNK